MMRKFLSTIAVSAVISSLALLAEPAPAVAFNAYVDDDGTTHELALDFLGRHAEGLECAKDRICPKEPLKRWELAVWLGRVLMRTEPDPVTKSRFVDVPDDVWWSDHVERFADLGITVGCADGSDRFCPDRVVNRAQMATFLVRAFDLPMSAASHFVDIHMNTHEANINAIAGSDVTVGCATEPARYCPNDPVTRGQMATFMGRAQIAQASSNILSRQLGGATQYVVPTWFCASEERYSTKTMLHIVADLDKHINEFYLRESGGRVNVQLVFKGSIKPNFERDVGFNTVFSEVYDWCPKHSIRTSQGNRQILVLVDVEESETAAGRAWLRTGPAGVSLEGTEKGEPDSPDSIRLHNITAHELGHSLFGFEHPDYPGISDEECKMLYLEVMATNRCYSLSLDPLSHYQVGCHSRQTQNWPCEKTNKRNTAGDVPASYQHWRFWQDQWTSSTAKGIQSASTYARIAGLPDTKPFYFLAYCSPPPTSSSDYHLSISWEDEPLYLTKKRVNSTIHLKFSDGTRMSVASTIANVEGAYRGVIVGEYRGATHSKAAKSLLDTLISKTGQTMVAAVYDDRGRRFEGHFDLEGADVALQSLLNFCD